MSDEGVSAVLARLDERTTTMANDIISLKQGYVTNDRFRPVEMLVYGMAGLILMAFMGAVVYVVLPHGAG